MAEATRGTIVEPVVPKEGVILKLTDYEAGVLVNVLNGVGGDPKGSFGVIDAIRREFLKIGVAKEHSLYQGVLTLL